MKTKVISTRDFSAIKKMAQIVNPIVSKKQTALRKIAALQEEIASYDEQIAGFEGGIKAKFLGLGTEQLVKKVVTPSVREDGTPVLDAKTGKQLSKTTYEPLPCLVYNKEDNNYTLTVEDEAPMTEQGNDFDIDAERIASEEAAKNAMAEEAAYESDNNPFNL